MGMGNWTRPGASSMQLLSLGRRSSTVSGLKSAWDTALSTLLQCKSGNTKPWSHWHPQTCVWLFESCEVWVPSWEVRGDGFVWTTGLWCRPQTLPGGLVVVDYRARCPSVLNKRMSRIKRQCSLVCCHLGFTPHIRDMQEAQTWWTKVLILQLQQDTLPTHNLAAAHRDDDDDDDVKTFTCAIKSPNSFFVSV